MAESKEEKKVKLNYRPVGSSGIINDQGIFGEEYLEALRGTGKHLIYDKMKRSESNVKMLLSAVKNLVRGAKFEIEGEDEKQIELINHLVLNKGLGKGSYKDLLGDILTKIEHGYSLFEKVHFNEIDKEIGPYTGLSLRFRSQKTIEEWHFDEEEKLSHVVQIDSKGEKRNIPAEFLVLFNIEAEGNNLEGISMLRPCYGPYIRKELKLKIEAIGMEKSAIPAPIARFLEDPDDDDMEGLKAILNDYTSNRAKYIILPPNVETELNSNAFDSTKIQASIDAEEKRMSKAFLANFLELGVNGTSGSFALSANQSDFFTKAIEYILDQTIEILNELIREIVDLNFPSAKTYPKLIASGVSENAGEEFSRVLLNLKNSGVLVPDERLEASVRKRYNLPEAEEETARGQAEAEPKEDFSQKKLKFSSKTKDLVSKAIKKEKVSLHEAMKKGLNEAAEKLVSDILKAYNKKSEKTKIDAIDEVKPKFAKYRKDLSKALFEVSKAGISIANKEIQAKKSFDDQDEKNVKKRVDAQARLLSQTQMADVEKAVYFSFISGVEAGKSFQELEFEMLEAKNAYIASNNVRTAATTTAAQMINDARKKHFFRKDVIDQIESFTFYNPNPESNICKSMNGRTVKANHPDLSKYWTPLHHNCDSTWLPNLVDADNPEISEAGPIPDSDVIKEKSL